ncbi:hypothetical protein COLU111180_16485 [Cohnella lubricantis]|nr:hypothetical protein [Cohnella lubricantis]
MPVAHTVYGLAIGEQEDLKHSPGSCMAIFSTNETTVVDMIHAFC